MNNKGFTVIELVISFAFVSVLTVSLFSLVMNYRDKELDTSDKVKITNFKNQITTLVERDIETKILRKAAYCPSGGGYINRCVELTFRDGTSKKLQIVYEESDPVNIASSTFTYFKYYVIYDDVIYPVPSQGNIEVRADYMLTFTNKEDDIENNIGLYRINLAFYHKSMDFNTEINIVAVGEGTNNTSGNYCIYPVGYPAEVDINSSCQKDVSGQWVCSESDGHRFYVIKSNTNSDSMVTLIDSVNEGEMPIFPSEASMNINNTFENSLVYTKLNSLFTEWTSIAQRSDIKILSADEISLLTSSPLTTKIYDVGETITLTPSSPALTFLNSGGGSGFWTSTAYLTTGVHDKMWYYQNGKLKTKSMLDASGSGVRPVIKIKKSFIRNKPNNTCVDLYSESY